MIPESTEDKDSPKPEAARRPGPSRFIVPAGHRIAEDADLAIPAASFLSREKICGKIRIPKPKQEPELRSPNPKPSVASSPPVVQNGVHHPENDSPTPKRGRGRPKRLERLSLPGEFRLLRRYSSFLMQSHEALPLPSRLVFSGCPFKLMAPLVKKTDPCIYDIGWRSNILSCLPCRELTNTNGPGLDFQHHLQSQWYCSYFISQAQQGPTGDHVLASIYQNCLEMPQKNN